MRRTYHENGSLQSVGMSRSETADWCQKWPCAGFGGRWIAAEFDELGDLVDLAVGDRGDYDGPAMCALLDDARQGKL